MLHDFHFASGETLPELRMHFTTIANRRDAAPRQQCGLILHARRSGRNLLNDHFAGVLFGAVNCSTQPLLHHFAGRHRHGKSSKPATAACALSQVRYQDMCAQHALVADGLQVDHLRL